MFLEHRTISRKTAADGRLEITKEAARRLEPFGGRLVIEVGGDAVPASLGTFDCTCRGPSKPHVHYFLHAERLKDLPAGSVVDLELDEPNARVVLHPSTAAP